MTEMAIVVKMAKTKPNYQKTAAALLERCREFYQNPENERAFQEWMAGKEKENEKG